MYFLMTMNKSFHILGRYLNIFLIIFNLVIIRDYINFNKFGIQIRESLKSIFLIPLDLVVNICSFDIGSLLKCHFTILLKYLKNYTIIL